MTDRTPSELGETSRVRAIRSRRARPDRLLRLPFTRPFSFWIPAVLVLAAGSCLIYRECGTFVGTAVSWSLAGTLLGSVLAGFVTAVAVGGPDTTLHSIEEARDYFQIPLLGAVPVAAPTPTRVS